MSPSRDTLVVCFDAETMDLTTNSTITQLCHSIKNADRTLVYYASPSTMKTFLKTNSILDYIAHHLSPTSILRDLVMFAYRFLMQKYVKDAQICIFGSSRGALAARVLAGMLHSQGLFPPGYDAQIPVAYKRYLMQENPDPIAIKEIKTEFVGVWDTIELSGLFQHSFPHIHSNPSIHKFRQALALDECTNLFRPILYYQDSPFVPNPTKASPEYLFEHDTSCMWFNGRHSDLIDGTADSVKASLSWMAMECASIEFHDISPENDTEFVLPLDKETWRHWIQTHEEQLASRIYIYSESVKTQPACQAPPRQAIKFGG